MKKSLLLISIVLCVLGLTSGITYAHGGEDVGDVEARLQEAQEAETKASAISRGQAIIADLKSKQKQPSSVESRKAVCESKQMALQTQMQAVVTAGRKQYKDLDAVLDPVIEYNTGENVPDFDRLVAQARADEEASQIALNIMEFMNVKLDCGKDTAALDVATFKAASEHASETLIASQKSIRAVILAVREAVK